MKQGTLASFLITPARLFMDRFRYAQKFTIIGALFMVPLLISSYLLAHEANQHTEQHRQQFIGVQHINNIQILIRDIQRHRDVSAAFLSGGGEFIEKRAIIQGDIARDIRLITDYYNKTYGKKTTLFSDPQHKHVAQEFENIVFGWYEVKGSIDSFRSPEESFRAHTEYLYTAISLIKDISDLSGLSTEEQLINKYLTGMLTATLPKMSEQISQSRAYGIGVPQGGMISKEEKARFITFSSFLRQYTEDLDRESNIIFQEQPEMEAVLTPKIHESKIALASLLDVYEKEFINSEIKEVSNDTYLNISKNAENAVFDIYDTLIAAFTVSTNMRVNEIVRERNIITGLSFGAFFLVTYFFIGFYAGVRRTLTTILQTTDTMLRDGVYRRPIPATTNDELGDIARSFNKIINALGSANNTLVRVNNNLSESMAKKKKAEDELRVRVEEIDKFNRLMIGRELKMIELNDEVLKLKKVLENNGGGV